MSLLMLIIEVISKAFLKRDERSESSSSRWFKFSLPSTRNLKVFVLLLVLVDRLRQIETGRYDLKYFTMKGYEVSAIVTKLKT